MNIENIIKLRGHVKLTVCDAKTGKTIPKDCHEFDNLIVTVGKNLIGDALIAAGNINMTYCGVGSITQVPAAGDTDLITVIGSRKSITDASRSGFVMLFSTFFASGDNNGTWNESGLFNAISSGTMLCRALFSSAFSKTTAKTATVDWSITIS